MRYRLPRLWSASRRAALLAACTLLAAGTAEAQQWPSKSVHLVVPFAPGGATDVVARIFAEKLSPRLGHPVLVENRPGGAATVGAAVVAKAAPDGHMLFVGSSPGFVNALALSKDPGFHPSRDFVAVSLLATQAFLLTLHPSMPPNNLKEFIDYVKAQPGKFNYASPGIGQPHHLAMELLKHTAGLDIVHVPFRGGAPMTQDVLAGQVNMMFGSFVIVGPHMKTNKLKPIAASGLRRVPQTPDIPTIAELGYPSYDVESWFGLVAPTGTPKGAIDRMATEVQAVAAMQDIKDRLLQIGFESAPVLTVAQFQELITRDIAKWTKVIKDAGIKPE